MTPQRVDAEPLSPTLFDLTAPVLSWIALRDEAAKMGDSQAVAEYQREIDDWLASEVVANRADGSCWMILEYKRRAEVAQAESERQDERAKRYLKEAQRIEDGIFRAMTAHGVSKIETETNTLTVKLNPPSLDVNETDLPPEYMTFTVKGIGYDQWCRLLGLLRSLVNGAPLADWLVETCEMTPLSKPVLKAMLKKGNIPGVSLKEEKYRLEME